MHLSAPFISMQIEPFWGTKKVCYYLFGYTKIIADSALSRKFSFGTQNLDNKLLTKSILSIPQIHRK